MDHTNAQRPLWGKHRGKVVDNTDNKGLGRIKVKVPGVTGDTVLQALPCSPYAGPQVGFFMIPPVGANVWVEFEGGEVDKPIWVGGFWGDGTQAATKPPTDATSPDVKVIQTEQLVLILDDQNSRLTAKLKGMTEKGTGQTMSLVLDKDGIILTSRQVTITITPAKIELKKDAAVIEITDDIKLKRPPATIEMSSSITLKNGGASAELSPAAIELTNGASSVALSPAAVNINKGALEVI